MDVKDMRNTYSGSMDDPTRTKCNDKDLVLRVMRGEINPLALASDRLRNDREVIREAIKRYGVEVLEYASDDVKCDPNFMKEVSEDLLVRRRKKID